MGKRGGKAPGWILPDLNAAAIVGLVKKLKKLEL
jgi:hypothetical protein